MKRLPLLFFIVATCAGCGGKGAPVVVENALDKFKVVKLFTVDGVTVYRFYDYGHARYLGVASTRISTDGVGYQDKNTTQYDRVDTVYRSGGEER